MVYPEINIFLSLSPFIIISSSSSLILSFTFREECTDIVELLKRMYNV